MDDLDACTICTETYGTEVRPRSLPCGHTLCSRCIDLKIELSAIVCPYCQKEHLAFSSSDFSINYTIEDLIAKLRETQLGAKMKNSSRQSESRSLRSRAQAVIDEQMKSLEKLLNECDFVKLNLNNYKIFLDEKKSQHKEVIVQIKETQHQHEEMVNIIGEEVKRITGLLSAGEEHQHEARSNLSDCENLSETTAPEQASDELERVFDKLNMWREKSSRHILSTDIIKRSEMIISESTLATVNRATAEATNQLTVELDDLQDSDASIMEGVNLNKGMDDLDTCTICTEPYDTKVRPRSLPCGHTLCSRCIDLKIELFAIVCPYCQKEHDAFSSSDFSINYTIEALIAKLRETQLGAKIKNSIRQSESWSLRSRAQAVIDEQMKSLERLLNECDSVKLDIGNYKIFLDERKSQHEEVLVQINEMLHQNEEMVNIIGEEDKKITGLLSAGEEHQQVARSNLSECEHLGETTAPEQASDELERVFDKLNMWREKSSRQILSTDIIKRSEMIISKSTLATVNRAIAEATNQSVELDDLQNYDTSIKERSLRQLTRVSMGRSVVRRRGRGRYEIPFRGRGGLFRGRGLLFRGGGGFFRGRGRV